MFRPHAVEFGWYAPLYAFQCVATDDMCAIIGTNRHVHFFDTIIESAKEDNTFVNTQLIDWDLVRYVLQCGLHLSDDVL